MVCVFIALTWVQHTDPLSSPLLTECVHELVAALGLVSAIDHGEAVWRGVVVSWRSLRLSVTAGAVIAAPGATARVWGAAAAAAAHLLNHLHLRTQL